MSPDLPYLFRWDRLGRKGEPCAVEARSGVSRPGSGPLLAFGRDAPKRFNTVRLVFVDGFRLTTSGNAIRRRP